jgi:CDP-6-deoxy-D-xylo-4-hexulose-3-dehydrase
MTTIEGGMISTNNPDLYELMLIKRSHGMARIHSPEVFKREAAKYPHIDPRFLFLTDGYNFRNTELAAVLGLAQLKRLDTSIDIRRRNFKYFFNNLPSEHFYIPNLAETNSSFCLPVICKDGSKISKIKKLCEEAGIETRPVVAGNLLLHPFLEKWKDSVKVPNANILNYNGFYVGNSQFVTIEMINTLKDILLLNV